MLKQALLLCTILYFISAHAQSTGVNVAIDHNEGTAIGGAVGGAAAIGFIFVFVFFLVQLSHESFTSSLPYRQKWPSDPMHWIELTATNKLFWVLVLQILVIVGLSFGIGNDTTTSWIKVQSPLPAISTTLFALTKGIFAPDPSTFFLNGLVTLCDSSMPVCPAECEGTGQAAMALEAFALALTVFSCLFVLKRIFAGDTMVFHRVTTVPMFLAAFYIFVACVLHGGWCFAEINKALQGSGLTPKHSVGFGASVMAFVFALWAGFLNRKFTYLTYATVTGGPGTTGI